MYQDCFNIYILLPQAFKTFVQVEIYNVLHEWGVEDCHLVARFENTWAARSRFERVGSQKLKANGQIGLPLRNFFFLIFLTPKCTVGIKSPKSPAKKHPKQLPSFNKRDERGRKNLEEWLQTVNAGYCK